LAARFSAGVEEFPNPAGEYAFDFQLIRYFVSLAMVDDFLVADPFLRELLRKVGFLKNGSGWSLLGVQDFQEVASALSDVRMQDISDVSRAVLQKEDSVSYENLVRNYIEFLNYTQNNGLTPFFYNSQSSFRQWGNLIERKNKRNEVIVDLSFKGKRQRKKKVVSKPRKPKKKIDIHGRMKLRRESDALLGGLKDSDPLIRQKAAESLGRLAEPENSPFLLKALSDSEPEVRQEIVRAVGNLPGEKVIEALLGVLAKDEVLSVRLIAAHALRRRSAEDALPVLLDAVEQGQPHFSTILAYHAKLKSDRFAIARLKGMACHENAVVRREVAFVLGRLSAKISSATLSSLAQDVDEETRINALYSLWDVRSPKVKDLSRKMSKSSSEVCARAGTVVNHWVTKRRHT